MNYPMPGPTDPAHDYPGYKPGQKRPTPWLWIALAVAVVIIVLLSAAVISQLGNEQSGSPAAAPQPSATQPAPQPSITPQQPSTGAASMTCEGFTASVDEGSQPGWHATINHYGLAYAVPPDWAIAACGVRMGWAKRCPDGQPGQCVVREIAAASTVPNPACEKQNLAIAGVASSKNADIRAALDEESKTVPVIYSQNGQVPQVEYGPVREFTVGNRPAVQMVANVTNIATDACNGPSAIHSMVVTTVPHVQGSVVFLISLREGVNATPKPDVINKIVATLRSPT